MKTLPKLFTNRSRTLGTKERYDPNYAFNREVDGESLQSEVRWEAVNAHNRLTELTSREREVLKLIAEGKANKVAAQDLCISIKTVEKHREHLMIKLGIHGTAGLTRYAIFVGLTSSNPYTSDYASL